MSPLHPGGRPSFSCWLSTRLLDEIESAKEGLPPVLQAAGVAAVAEHQGQTGFGSPDGPLSPRQVADHLADLLLRALRP